VIANYRVAYMNMRYSIPFLARMLLLVSLSLVYGRSLASHIVGGEVAYHYLGAVSGGYKYQVSLTIYEDCLSADTKPEIIAQDNPAHITIFDLGTGKPFSIDSVYYTSSDSVPSNFNNACVANPPMLCLLKKTFDIVYTLPPNASGYIVAYQRCCRNASVANIVDAKNTGCTYFCIIPPYPATNNSAVFTNYPPQLICLNNPLHYDHSATDADGDSLSYCFCNALVGNVSSVPNSPPDPPPYDSVQWLGPAYDYTRPISGKPRIQINPATGEITGTPDRTGRYLITVCCNEWRNGVVINTIKREFQFVVTDCSRPVVACMPQYSTEINTYIVNCTDFNVHFDNCSKGGKDWHWDFGVPGIATDVSGDFEPSYTYPDTGIFHVKLVVNPGTTCQDSITRLVKIFPKFSTGFSDSGRFCTGAPILFKDLSVSTTQPTSSWQWDFGDGNSSAVQNPAHSYDYGGLYHVILVAGNPKACSDTAIQYVRVENFTPFAGSDTTIVKGEKIHFDATGGDKYVWSPATNLDDTTVYNPTGYYPDTGHFGYTVHIESPYGCSGNSSIHVTVVNDARFFMPTAFTPNGDGMNDVFRPIAIGYKDIKYFRVYNRWGQLVYDDNSFETGWDGTYNNKQAEMGVYYWEIIFTDRHGKDSFLKGDVTLVR
jgi:gliding motility-associated-like protein